MAEGHETPANQPELRPPAPHRGGPLGSSGAAPPESAGAGSEKPAAAPPAAKPAEPKATEPAPAAPKPAPPPVEAEPAAEAKPVTKAESGAGSPADGSKLGADAKPTAEAKAAGDAKPAADTNAAGDAKPTADANAAGDVKTTADAKPAADAKTAGDVKPAKETTPAADLVGGAGKSGGKDGGGALPGAAAAGGVAATKVGEIDLDKPAVVTVTSASGTRVTRVLRRANPIRVARTAGRTTHAWAKRPTGRLLIPAIVAVLLIAGAGTAGAYLVPEALEAAPSPSATPAFGPEAAAPGPTAVSGAPLPSGAGPVITPPAFPNPGGARPADALAGWAQGVGTRVAIPVVAVQAYGYAELVLTRTAPNCHLSWTTIAAIASVESAHGSANDAVLGADGVVQPPIYGLPLDGNGGRSLIRDTDQGLVDGDKTYDRAVGPLQFIPSTWQEMQVDADNSGASDPNDIDDASLAAAMYLCKGGRDLSKADAWWDAILSYNAVRPYAQKVFDTANEYGVRSRV